MTAAAIRAKIVLIYYIKVYKTCSIVSFMGSMLRPGNCWKN